MTKVVIDWTKTFCLKLCNITNRDKSVQVAHKMVLTRAVCRRQLLVCEEWQSALEWTVAGVFAERYFHALQTPHCECDNKALLFLSSRGEGSLSSSSSHGEVLSIHYWASCSPKKNGARHSAYVYKHSTEVQKQEDYNEFEANLG